jgi:hypothetical protein
VGLVRCTVEVDQGAVEVGLGCEHAICHNVVECDYIMYRRSTAQPTVPRRVAVAQFERFGGAGGGAGRDGGDADRPAFEFAGRLHGRPPPAIEDFEGGKLANNGHLGLQIGEKLSDQTGNGRRGISY